MIELAFVVCLAADPEVCEDRALTYLGDSPMSCMFRASPELAAWSARNADWTIESWTCRVVDLSRSDT